MAPTMRSEQEFEDAPWRRSRRDWQQRQGQRLERMRRDFRAQTDPAGRRYWHATEEHPPWSVSLSPRDEVIMQRKRVWPELGSDPRHCAMQHYRCGEEGLRATGFRLVRHTHMVLGRPVQVFLPCRLSSEYFPAHRFVSWPYLAYVP